MKRTIAIEENGLHVVLEVDEAQDVRLLHFSALPFDEADVGPEKVRRWFRLVELQVSGEDHDDHHGSKYTGTMPAARMRYESHRDGRNEAGRKVEVALRDPQLGLRAVSHMQFYDGVPVARCWTELVQEGDAALTVEYVSSFALTGLAKEGLQPWERKMKLHLPHNTWFGESQWRAYSLPEFGLQHVNHFSLKRISVGSVGTWSTSQYLPMGYLDNTETGVGLVWQIEHNGSWHWELSDIGGDWESPVLSGHLYLQLSGPTQNEGHFSRTLAPGETFLSVPVAVGSAPGFEAGIQALTRYRRRIRRPNEDNRRLPIIFNDYMNCLMGDPTTEKLLPLIDAAAEAGCETFCIDAGWYSDGLWWDGVGEWLPSQKRFPGGLQEVLDAIAAKGMVPGLWLELEVMGINCPLAPRVPDDWFFMRHGKRVIDHGRYQLDYRNPAVVAHADSVIDRLVSEYKVGYIKMDYNINAGIGTEVNADSFGHGLLEHNRAYLRWLDAVFVRYPHLVIENCSSGGMRADYALLSRHSIFSSSDQMNYRKNAVIAAASPAAITPEQCAVWSYPLRDGDGEEVVVNMVNAMLLRVHQSGHLAAIGGERAALVKEGLRVYRSIRGDIPHSVPFWPLGMPTLGDGWISLGLDAGDKLYVAVWRLGGADDTCALPIARLRGQAVQANRLYPAAGDCRWRWNADAGTLTVSLPGRCSTRLFELRPV